MSISPSLPNTVNSSDRVALLSINSKIESFTPAGESLTKFFWAAVAPLDVFVGVFFTQPLADALALKTYTHGTNFSNYLNIRCWGADPTKGGAANGSSAASPHPAYLESSRGYFHLFKDVSDINLNHYYYEMDDRVVQFAHGVVGSTLIDPQGNEIAEGKNGVLLADGISILLPSYSCCTFQAKSSQVRITSPYCNKIEGRYMDRWDKIRLRAFLPLEHALKAGSSNWTKPHARNTLLLIIGGLSGCVTPIISIRTAAGDPIESHFEIDPDYCDYAYRTKFSIPSSYMGLEGILRQGLSGNIWQRVKANPIKVSLGLMRLTLSMTAIWLLFITQKNN